MGVPVNVQIRALIALLEDLGVGQDMSDEEAQRQADDLLWAFLNEVHPDEVAGLRSRPAPLVQDLYKDEFEAWRMAKRRADMDASERFVFDLAMGEMPGDDS